MIPLIEPIKFSNQLLLKSCLNLKVIIISLIHPLAQHKFEETFFLTYENNENI